MKEIYTHIGDIFDVKEGIIVHGCNAQGVMGSGIAKTVKEKFPGAFRDYKRLIDSTSNKNSVMGRIMMTEVHPRKLYIANAITQLNYGTDKNVVYVDYNALGKAFQDVGYYSQHYKLDVHFPLIGCGLANGDWDKVSEMINKSMPKEVRKHLWVLE